MLPTFYVPVPGTWGWQEKSEPDWWQSGSTFELRMAELNLIPLREEPFEWSTNLDGHQFWLRIFNPAGPRRRTWKAAGKALRYYLGHPSLPEPYYHRNLIVHSHGLQVALYAASYGLKIRTLVSVGSPIRDDVLKDVGFGVIGNIGSWLHLSDGRDGISRVGLFNDGKINWPWRKYHTSPLADFNDECQGHSNVLTDPVCMDKWGERGWADFLRFGTFNGSNPRERAGERHLDRVVRL